MILLLVLAGCVVFVGLFMWAELSTARRELAEMAALERALRERMDRERER